MPQGWPIAAGRFGYYFTTAGLEVMGLLLITSTYQVRQAQRLHHNCINYFYNIGPAGAMVTSFKHSNTR
jgi:hypothetical protein